MTRSPRLRLVSLLFALLGPFTAPVSAVAHGVEHSREAAGHRDMDHHSAGHHRAAAEADPAAHAVAALDGEDSPATDHRHPTLGTAVTAKSAASLLAVMPPRVTLSNAAEHRVAPTRRQAAVQDPASPAGDAPPRLRAPPAFPG